MLRGFFWGVLWCRLPYSNTSTHSHAIPQMPTHTCQWRARAHAVIVALKLMTFLSIPLPGTIAENSFQTQKLEKKIHNKTPTPAPIQRKHVKPKTTPSELPPARSIESKNAKAECQAAALGRTVSKRHPPSTHGELVVKVGDLLSTNQKVTSFNYLTIC